MKSCLIFPFVALFVLLKNISCICTNKLCLYKGKINHFQFNEHSCEGKNIIN